ncbi:hypothetical protein BDW59DRAFT_94934 [Aspergillus cavernicola]|uniref:Uncharacterized protein n=1 Tax=Aspergillus cavernicola TaxID=176166 RepID=A0ABR4IZ06_9EURO
MSASPWTTFTTAWTQHVEAKLFANGVNPKPDKGSQLEYPLSLHTYARDHVSGVVIYRTDALTVEVCLSKGNKQYITKMLDFPSNYDESEVKKFYYFISPQLVAASRREDGLQGIFKCLSDIKHETTDNPYEDVFGRWAEGEEAHYGEASTPFAIYTWELAYHLPCLIMERLMACQQFELALKVARLAFDPSTTGTDIGRC